MRGKLTLYEKLDKTGFILHWSIKKASDFKSKQMFERSLKNPIYNENYYQIGLIKDIFGPIERPFISIKTLSNQEFNSNESLNLYAKIIK